MKKITEYKFEIEKNYEMNVPGIIYASEKLLKDIGEEPLKQVSNVACLPGIINYSIAMPDIHWGYGFPIGGVAAFDTGSGIISPGGVGYDINCGVRMIRTNLFYNEIKDKIDELAINLYNNVPSGVGSSGKIILDKKELKKVIKKGARWAIENGFGTAQDIERIEDKGHLECSPEGSDISEKAYERGLDQLGTLGAGNHFLEVQKIDKIFNKEIADKLGLKEDLIVIMFHTGSRGFGYQICDDYIALFRKAAQKYRINLKDQQLACAPFSSEEGQRYFNAMKAAANYAWANRQVITDSIRRSFEKIFKKGYQHLGMDIIYDVAHNIARVEEIEINNEKKFLCVHRKGATRSLPPEHYLLVGEYKEIGQPVLVPGDMGRHSFILVGKKESKETFYSCAHGAGRLLSRHQALKQGKNINLIEELEKQGVIVKAKSKKLLTEEAPFAYKNVEDITDIVEKAGLANKVARLKPVAVVKG